MARRKASLAVSLEQRNFFIISQMNAFEVCGGMPAANSGRASQMLEISLARSATLRELYLLRGSFGHRMHHSQPP